MGLRRLLSRHAALSLEKQLHLGEVLGECAWSFDLVRGTLTFGEGGERRTWRVQILGTESIAAGTWLWAWANEQSDIPPRLLETAQRMRALGELEGIEELLRPELPLGELDGHVFASVASGVTGAAGYYRCPYQGGAMYAVIDHGDFALAQTDAPRMTTVITQAISSFDVDHRIAFEAYLTQHEATLSESGNRITAALQAGGSVSAEFDPEGRLTNLSAQGLPAKV